MKIVTIILSLLFVINIYGSIKKMESTMQNETDYTNNPLTKEQESQIDTLFSEYESPNTPGCAIGVIQNGKFIYKKSFGMANMDYDIPITADSKFELASNSKQFTAACIVLLHLEGKLDLEDDVRKYINELPDYGKTITIRHLLNHTSGIRNYDALLSLSDFQLHSFFTTEDAVRLICKQKKIDFLPGEKFSYSNSGYVLLAEIVKRISGKPLREYADEKIFKPLAMNDTFYNDDCTETIKNRVIGYYAEKNDKFKANFYNNTALGDAGVISTVNDLLKWDENFNKPIVGGQKMLDNLLTKGVLNNGETIYYALGLMYGSYKGLNFIEHDGRSFGFRTELIRFPVQKTSMIILANRSDADSYNLALEIAEIIFKPKAVDLPDKTVESKVPVTISLTKSELEKFCGNFWYEEDKLNRKIYLKNEELFYWRNEESESQLLPISQNELTMVGTQSAVRMEFINNQNSKTINFYEDDKLTSVFKSYQPIDFTREYLAKHTGKYFCEDLDIFYQLKMESDTLVVCIKDKQKYKLKALMAGMFIILDEDDDESGYISFIYNKNKQISGFKVDTERAKNIEFVKIK